MSGTGSTSRRAFSVALIGCDGAGKTTVARELERGFSRPVKYLYMGVNLESSPTLLPTTRLVRAVRARRAAAAHAPSGAQTQRRGFTRRTVRPLRTMVAMTNRLAEEWHRQFLAWRHMRRGTVVVFDRHFGADYHYTDVAVERPASMGRRVHGFVLSRFYPKPDLVVFLDAPPEVVLARKGEGTLDSLARRREEYFGLADVYEHFVVVDADRPLPEVVDDVAAAIVAFDGRASAHAGALPASPGG